MNVSNPNIVSHPFLQGMYDDAYFPNHLVDRVKQVLLDACHQIETSKPTTAAELLRITHAATEQINDLNEVFGEHESELETGAREVMAMDFGYIARAYGFEAVDIEDLIATRDW